MTHMSAALQLPPEPHSMWRILVALLLGAFVLAILAGMTACTNSVPTASAWRAGSLSNYTCPPSTAPTMVKGAVEEWFFICRPVPEVCRNMDAGR